jgi:hypothetical protein
MLRWPGKTPPPASAHLLPNSGLPIVASQDGLLSIDFSSCEQFQPNTVDLIEGLLELIPHCLPGVNNMSKEHKNKRDTKKKPALSPKEKKAAKLVRKDTKNILGN